MQLHPSALIQFPFFQQTHRPTSVALVQMSFGRSVAPMESVPTLTSTGVFWTVILPHIQVAAEDLSQLNPAATWTHLGLHLEYEGHCCDYSHCPDSGQPVCDETGVVHRNLCFFEFVQCTVHRKSGKYMGEYMTSTWIFYTLAWSFPHY